jgi:hypothetical protein
MVEHGIYSPIVTLTVSVLVYILTYCNADSVGHGIYLPIVRLIVSVMVYTHLL